MPESVILQIARLKTASAGALKDRWRELFGGEPPPYNRRFLESRLVYRLQELAHGGLSVDTARRLWPSQPNYRRTGPGAPRPAGVPAAIGRSRAPG